MRTRHTCPECGRKTPVGPSGMWYSHMRGDDMLTLCPLSARPAPGLSPSDSDVFVFSGDEVVQVDVPVRRPSRPFSTAVEEGVSVRTVSGGSPGLGRRR